MPEVSHIAPRAHHGDEDLDPAGYDADDEDPAEEMEDSLDETPSRRRNPARVANKKVDYNLQRKRRLRSPPPVADKVGHNLGQKRRRTK